MNISKGLLQAVVGDITSLRVDVVVNAANKRLAGGGGVDGRIHAVAGHSELSTACREIAEAASSKGEDPCPPGMVKVTSGFKLPAKFIFHTVGPTNRDPNVLANCYRNCMDQLVTTEIQGESIAFPCIATGVYHYPKKEAARIAISTVDQWIREHPSDAKQLKKVVFCCYSMSDFKIYEAIMNDMP